MILVSEPTHSDWEVSGSGVWLSNWTYRKAHNISGSTAGTQINYPMMMNVHYDNGFDFEGDVYLNWKCRADFGDIRFTDWDGQTLFDYWIEQQVNSDYAIIWVEAQIFPPFCP